MAILNVIIVLLLFEPRMITGRAYNCYISIPCPLTRPCSEPSWNCNLSIQNMLMKCGECKPETPCPLSEPWGCPPYWQSCEPYWQPIYPPCRQLCYQPYHPNHPNNQKKDLKTKKLLTLLSLPGFLADTFLKGQVVL